MRPGISPKAWLARHAQTLVGSVGRLVRGPGDALLTMSVIAVALALPLLLDVFLQNMRAATANWDQVFDISVYLDKQAAPPRAEALATQWRQRSDVAAVRVITADEALREFRSSGGFGSALDALSDNPLPDTLVVTPAVAASTPAGMDTLQHELAGTPDVQTVQVDTDWVRRLHALLDVLHRVNVLAAALLGAGVLLIVGNTVRLDVENRRSEIEVMKLVGATDGFARRPFLYSGVWYGLGGGVLALIVVAASIAALAGPVSHLASLYGSAFRLRGLDLQHAAAIVGCAAALGWLGSWLAATRHIKRIEPT